LNKGSGLSCLRRALTRFGQPELHSVCPYGRNLFFRISDFSKSPSSWNFHVLSTVTHTKRDFSILSAVNRKQSLSILPAVNKNSRRAFPPAFCLISDDRALRRHHAACKISLPRTCSRKSFLPALQQEIISARPAHAPASPVLATSLLPESHR
jgi:hypothetical protein